MESQTTATKNASRKNAKKTETESVAATTAPAVVSVTAVQETTTEKKKEKVSRSKKNETETTTTEAKNETIIEAKSEENIPSPTVSETTPVVSFSVDEYVERSSQLADESAQIANILKKNLKQIDGEKSKELIANFDKISKNFTSALIHIANVLQKENAVYEKEKNKSENKKNSTPKVAANPSSYAINKPKETLPFVLKSMGKQEGELVSRNQVQNHMISLIKNNLIDYQVTKEGKVDNKVFYINKGVLGDFFKNVEQEVKRRGFKPEQVKKGYFDENGNLPEYAEYNMLMGYASFCFPPAPTAPIA